MCRGSSSTPPWGGGQEPHGWDCQRAHGTPSPHRPVFTLSPQVPLYPLPPVPRHTLVSSLCHLLAVVVETLSLGAPGIQRAQGPLLYALALVSEALQGYVYVCVCLYLCVCVACPPMLQTAGQSCSSGSGRSVPNYTLRATPRAVVWDLCLDLCSGG